MARCSSPPVRRAHYESKSSSAVGRYSHNDMTVPTTLPQSSCVVTIAIAFFCKTGKSSGTLLWAMWLYQAVRERTTAQSQRANHDAAAAPNPNSSGRNIHFAGREFVSFGL